MVRRRFPIRFVGALPLPIRHGEGKIFTLDSDLLEKIEAQGCAAARYVDAENNPTQEFPANPNGSLKTTSRKSLSVAWRITMT